MIMGFMESYWAGRQIVVRYPSAPRLSRLRYD
jgi:hypothetical protein